MLEISFSDVEVIFSHRKIYTLSWSREDDGRGRARAFIGVTGSERKKVVLGFHLFRDKLLQKGVIIWEVPEGPVSIQQLRQAMNFLSELDLGNIILEEAGEALHNFLAMAWAAPFRRQLKEEDYPTRTIMALKETELLNEGIKVID